MTRKRPTVFFDPTVEKPTEPKPEHFGLTEKRARLLENPFEPLRIAAGGSGLLLGLVLVLYIAQRGWGWVFALLSGPVITILCLGVSILFFGSISSGWLRLQPDWKLFKEYTDAKKTYKQQLGIWAKEQEIWARKQEIWWQSLDGRSFERELGKRFEQAGYVVRHTGGAGDEGVDLVLEKEGKTVIVQCKAHQAVIGPATVRDLYGAMTHRRDQEAWLISTHGFSEGARAFADGKPIRLISIGEILRSESISFFS